MSVPADRSDPRKLAERFVDTEEGVVLIEDGARGLRSATHFEIELRAGLLAALDREAEAKADHVDASRVAWRHATHLREAEAQAEAAYKALREIDAEATRVLWDHDGVPTEPMFDELAIKIIAAREALAAAEGQQP